MNNLQAPIIFLIEEESTKSIYIAFLFFSQLLLQYSFHSSITLNSITQGLQTS